MERVLRVLIVGDRVDNAELVCRELCHAGFVLESLRVETESDYLAALRPELDVIIVDHHLLGFDASRALALVKQRALEVPVIVVSGITGEELAVRMMQEGAADYLLKDHLGRLGMAVRRVLEQSANSSPHNALTAGTALSGEEQARSASGVDCRRGPRVEREMACVPLPINRRCASWEAPPRWTWSVNTCMSLCMDKRLQKVLVQRDEACICGQLCQDQDVHVVEETLRQPDGRTLLVECRSHPIRHADQIVGYLVTLHDFTERRRIEREVLEISERERCPNRTGSP